MLGQSTFTKLALAATMAAGVSSLAVDLPLSQRGVDCFNLKVINSCATAQSFGIYQMTPEFTINTITPPTTVEAGKSFTFDAPYKMTGLRMGTNPAQFEAQSLFEWGYSAWGSVEGTAYDISMMDGLTTGMKVTPNNTACETKICSSLGCQLSAAWQDAAEVLQGSPADTVCYQGKTDFTVEWCATV